MNAILSIWRGENPAAERAKRILETLFLALSGVYLIYLFTLTTTLYVPYPLGLERRMILALAAVAALRVALIGPMRAEAWLAAGLAVLCGAVYWSVGYGFLLFLAVLAVGYVRVDYRRILKTWLISVGGMFAVVVVAALSGGITNIVYFREGLRSSWGICYPTDLASISLFLLLMLWVVLRRLPDWALLPLGCASLAMAGVVAMSRNGLICGALFCCAIGYHWLESAVLSKRARWRWVVKGVDGFLVAAYPLFAAAFFLLVLLYARDLPIAARLDGLLSQRLKQCLEGFRLYGLHALGTPFDQIGNGFSVFPQQNVNFIDSSYMLILLRYGWVMLLVQGLLWGVTIRRALRCGDRRLALAMGLIAFHSMLEHHFTEVNYNILLAMPFAAYAASPAKAGTAPDRRTLPAGIAALLAVLGAALLAGPRLLTRLRTLFQAEGYVGGGAGALPIVAIVLAALAVAAGAAWAVLRLIAPRGAGKGPRLRALAALALCAAVGLGLWAWSGREVARASGESEALLEADREALELALGAAENPVYSDVLPDVYRSGFEGLSDSALPLEDLARREGCTVLADGGQEYNVFFQRGFQYVPISKAHALYTADGAVIGALTQAGYVPSGYYSAVRHVDLERCAELNQLRREPSSGLLLEGPAHSLVFGPYIDLYGGLYTAVYTLRLPEGAMDDPGEVCRLRVACFEGETLLAEVSVSREQFGPDGRLEVPMSFEVGYAPSLDFLAYAGEGRQVWVEDIRFVKERGMDSD